MIVLLEELKMKVLNIEEVIEVKGILNNLGIKNVKKEFKEGSWILKSTTKNNYIEIDNSTDQNNYINLKYYARPDSSYIANVLVEIDFLAGFLERQVNYRSEEHTSELQSRFDLVCRLLLEKKKQ